MNQSKPIQSRADAAAGDAMQNEGGGQSYAGGAGRASLLPREIASRQAHSADLSPLAYPEPAGASVYQWWDDAPATEAHKPLLALLQSRTGNGWKYGSNHLNRGVHRSWWHWPTISTAAVLTVGGLILAMSDSAIGADVSYMLHKLI